MPVSDYFDNDMVHVSRAIGDIQYKNRLSFLSKKQNRAKIAFEVIKDVNIHPENYPFPIDIFDKLGIIVLELSPSVTGKGIGVLGEVLGGRVAVEDKKVSKGKEEVDLEKV